MDLSENRIIFLKFLSEVLHKEKHKQPTIAATNTPSEARRGRLSASQQPALHNSLR